MNRFIFTENSVGRTDGEAFQVDVSGRILIENNTFSQFSYLAFSGTHFQRANIFFLVYF